MNAIRRAIVVIPFKKEDTPELIDGSNAIWAKMSGSTTLIPTPTPALQVLRSQIDDFVAANTLTKTNKGALPAREAKREILWGSLVSERGCVQQICDATPEQAGTIAAAAAMRLKNHKSAVPKLITGALTTTKGTVHLEASLALLVAMLPPVKGKSGKRTILWRYTLDGARTFVEADATPFVRTDISGLPLATDVGFQVALKDRRGTTPWSQTFILHVY